METTLRRRKRLQQMQRDMEEAELVEKDAVVATTRAQKAVNQAKRTRDSVAAPTPPPRHASRASTRGRNDLGTLSSSTVASN